MELKFLPVLTCTWLLHFHMIHRMYSQTAFFNVFHTWNWCQKILKIHETISRTTGPIVVLLVLIWMHFLQIWTTVCHSSLETLNILKINLAKKGANFLRSFLKYRSIFHNFWQRHKNRLMFWNSLVESETHVWGFLVKQWHFSVANSLIP